MDSAEGDVVDRSVKDVHKTLGMWSIRKALAVAFGGASVLVVAVWFLVSWLLGFPARAKAQPLDTRAQLDLIKLVFALVAGIGALVALVTAYRRQRTEELAGERAERIQAHTEQVARDNAHDATERRVTDLYGKAVEQLGHDKAAVRLGGLYSLERLAEDYPRHRQTVVDVVCAYLRMPFQSPGHSSGMQQSRPDDSNTNTLAVSQDDLRQELQVRLTAQRLLTHRLNTSSPPGENEPSTYPGTYWEGMDIDLTSAYLIDLNFSNCRPRHADFTEARFSGITRFELAKVSGVARFDQAEFGGDALFVGAEFGANARFDQAKFGADARFDQVRFGADARFDQTDFGGVVRFAKAEFGGNVSFVEAKFGGDARFAEARVRGDASFAEAQFGGNALFVEAEFGGVVWFAKAKFNGSVQFVDARFMGITSFDHAELGRDASFAEVQFSESVRFVEARFKGRALFDQAEFSGTISFDLARVMGDASFAKVQFSGSARFVEAKFTGSASFDQAEFSGSASFAKAEFGGDARFDKAKFSRGQCDLMGAIASHTSNRHRWPPHWQADPTPNQIMASLVQR